MNKLILILLLSLSMTAHAQVSGPGNTFGGGGGGSSFVFNTSNASFPQSGECVSWYGGRASSCSSASSEYVVGKATSLNGVRFTLSGSNAGAFCTIKAIVRKANSTEDTEIGSITLTDKKIGEGIFGLPYALSPGDRLKVMVGEDQSSLGCTTLDGSLFVEM